MSNPLHLALYQNLGKTVGISRGAVVYTIDRSRKQCVYSGITPEVTSTINAEEEIVLSICQQERMDPYTLRFFDLQTHRSYGHLDPGDFEFDKIIPKPEYQDCWQDDFHIDFAEATCPPDIRKLFRTFIGKPIGTLTPHDARAFHFAPTDRYASRLQDARNFIFQPGLEVVVDNEGRSDLLEAAQGNRWTVWQLDPKQFKVERTGPDPYHGL